MAFGPSRHNYFINPRRNKVVTIEVSLHEDIMDVPFREGIHTIKNINPKTSDDLFYITPDNVTKGYLPVDSDKRVLNLITGTNKIVKSICNSYYHSVLDDLSEVIAAIQLNPGYEVILDISDISHEFRNLNLFIDKYFHTFLKVLEKHKVKYKLVEFKNYDLIYIDNFKSVYFAYDTGQKTNLVYDFYKKILTKKKLSVRPYRKIFVSRTQQVREDVEAEGLSYLNDRRIDDAEGLDKLFESLGFEVVIAENIPTFAEQFELFYEAKVVAGVTGSGLTNVAFMQPGGTVIEIVTPLIVTIPPPAKAKDVTRPWYTQELHNFYKDAAFFQNHNYVALQNADRSLEDLKKNLESNTALLEYLKNV